MSLSVEIESKEIEDVLRSYAASLNRDPKDLVIEAVVERFDLRHLTTMPAFAAAGTPGTSQ
jgi:hypothetical protein